MNKTTQKYLARLSSDVLKIYLANNHGDESVNSPEYKNAESVVESELMRISNMCASGYITELEAVRMIAKFATV